MYPKSHRRFIFLIQLAILSFMMLITNPGQALGQYLGNDQEAPGIDWKVINSDHFEIIFPEEISGEANRLANLLEATVEPAAKTLNYKFKKISLLLTTRGVISNGYVAMAPRRSEWYGVPIMNSSYDEDWYQFLASHELRHVVQYDKLLNRGFNIALKYISGEQFVSVWNSLIVPRWFWEGDAVATETALSEGGRGRQAEFNMGIRAQLLSEQRLSYYQAALGSYKRYTPDPYALGYHLITYGRRHVSEKVWANALGRTSFFIFTPFAFTSAIRGVAKQSVPAIYKGAMDELQTQWRNQQDKLNLTPAVVINQRKTSVPTDYLYPQYLADCSIIALKEGLGDAQTLIRFDEDGNEHEITRLFTLYSISAKGTKVVWSDLSFHPRWTKESYSDLIVLDLQSNEKRKLTYHGRFFTPCLSADGQKIAAAEYSIDRKSSLVVLDAETGQVLKRIVYPGNEVIKMPGWSEDGQRIVFTHQGLNGKGLSIFDLETDAIQEILPACWQGLSQPVFYGNFVLFHSHYSGIDNIFAVNVRNGQQYQVTSRPLGAFNPTISADGRRLLFNDYSRYGHDVAVMELDSTRWLDIADVQDGSVAYYEPLMAQEQGQTIFSGKEIPSRTFAVENYNAAAHLFNFHSWYISPDTLNLGIYLVSRDILNTMDAGVGGYYNINEQRFGYAVNASYAGFYPIIDMGLSRYTRTTIYDLGNNKTLTDNWWESTGQIGLRLPLNLFHDAYAQQLELAVTLKLITIEGQKYPEKWENSNGNLAPLSYQLLYSRGRLRAARDIKTQWGQSLQLYYAHTPFHTSGGNIDYQGNLLGAQAKLFFPGLMKHHAFWLSADYEQQNPQNYRFLSLALFPRGFNYKFYEKFYKATVNYGLPLFYPDFHLGGLFYLKRIKSFFFYDYGLGKGRSVRGKYQSVGAELLFDQHWFSFPIEFEAGYRFSYLLSDDRSAHQIVIGLPLD